jgi:hypothetical protein
VIRETKFLISRKPFAVDLDSFRIKFYEAGKSGLASVDAVWFRRRRGVTVACIGSLHTWEREEPASATAFLEAYTDGRYGGDCVGRWDGSSYWGNVPLAVQEQHLAVLRPMLANFPAVPAGYDGWWTFQPAP